MDDERLQILKMVEEGKLSAEEATRLLEALEKGRGKARNAASPTYIRFRYTEGTKVNDFSIRVGMVRWVLSWPLQLEWVGERLDSKQLLRMIEEGFVGKALDYSEGARKLEIWLEP